MDIPEEAIKEFKEIYEKEFKEKLTDSEYRIRAENFLRLMKLITTPIPKEKIENKKSELFTKNLTKLLLDQAEESNK